MPLIFVYVVAKYTDKFSFLDGSKNWVLFVGSKIDSWSFTGYLISIESKRSVLCNKRYLYRLAYFISTNPTSHISCSNSIGVASLVLILESCCPENRNPKCVMAKLSKNVPLCSLDIGSVYARVEFIVVSSPRDKMFNTALVTSAHYFI